MFCIAAMTTRWIVQSQQILNIEINNAAKACTFDRTKAVCFERQEFD
jgi:hypothetical protein